MKIKLKTNMADANGAHQAGAHLTVDDKEGRLLVAGGYAEEIKPKAAAALPPPPDKPIPPGAKPPAAPKGPPAGQGAGK